MTKTKSASVVLSKRQLTDLAVTYAALLGVEFEKWENLDGEWIGFGQAEEGQATLIHGRWHWGPHPSLYVVAAGALGVLGYRMRRNGDLYEI